MTIKNRDGTPYRLQAPNPFLVQQNELWSDEKIAKYNFDWKKITEESQKEPVIIEEKSKDTVTEEKTEFVPVKEKPTEKSKSQTKISLWMHCLPTIVSEHKDKFYNENIIRTNYGQKFDLETYLIEAGDLSLSFWTTKNLISGSVVFPFRWSDGQSYADYRWWKIIEAQEKEGGWIFDAIPSTLQPDFSG